MPTTSCHFRQLHFPRFPSCSPSRRLSSLSVPPCHSLSLSASWTGSISPVTAGGTSPNAIAQEKCDDRKDGRRNRGSFGLHSLKFSMSRIPMQGGALCSKSRLSVGNEGVQTESAIRAKDAVIIVDHGSRRQESNLMLNEFVSMFKGRTSYEIVEPAHMELAEPSIKDAFKSCVQQGASRIIVSPFFLFPGRHWHQDIPALAAEAAKEHSGISYIVTAPLGLHERLVDVMNDRIKYCLSHVNGDTNECSVCAGTGKCRIYQ
ncbi:hypothetical protein J5N97_002731 [Dioscorea zingiberensis]|uniref:Sirohydrochlorin ferrochelatase n=1 Tax=Dioscorea zingiberensis TaxID=325984 RepID=A0A9D5HPH0_9LILI|nr:hypothetical protein J5N97_002731 [Dioscorea zingiberensis]